MSAVRRELDAETIARTEHGSVRGRIDEGAHVFLGIPYAAPPFGEHRFAAPVPPDAWDGVRDALRYGPTAPQRDPIATIIPEPVEPGEDYLNLNVFTPELGDVRLPVLVWIHGGGFVSGCNRSPWYRGTRFARDGVVLVTIGYRLGVEGFLDVEKAPPNRAVLDWMAALGWVQDNIAAFGGDPSKVTIAGQSAGSAACLTLLTNPRARGLFRSVIAMSGTSDTRMPRASASELTSLVASHLNVAPTREALADFTPTMLIDVASEVVPNPFSAESLASGFDTRAPALKPFVDGDVIPEHPYREISDGVGADIPVLAGSTAQELNGLVRMRMPDLDDTAATNILTSMGLSDEKLKTYSAHVGSTSAHDVLGQAMTDRAFRAPLAALLEDRAATGAPTFGYQFSWGSPLFDGVVGACHCVDVPFAFDNLDAERVTDGLHGPNPPQELADEMHTAFVRFVSESEPGWPAYETERRAIMRFDVPSGVTDDPLRVERELFPGSRR